MISVETAFEPDFDKEGNPARVGHYITIAHHPPYNIFMADSCFWFPTRPYWRYNHSRKEAAEVVVEPVKK